MTELMKRTKVAYGSPPRWSVVLAAALLSTLELVFGQNPTLKIGDHAPVLKPFEWIKGEPLTAFKEGTVYVVEMGATWCKPCAVAIPKLTKIAKKYKGQVEVIGVFVQEMNYEPINTPNPKYLEKVRKYVERQGDDMEYLVAVDGPEKTIDQQWIDGMGKGRGVPQTFVIDKNGIIAGHFTGMDEVSLEALLVAILDDSYSLETQIEKDAGTRALRFDHYKPLFVGGNAGKGDDFIFRSILTKADEEIGGYVPDVVDGHLWVYGSKSLTERYREVMGSVQVVNSELAHLYYIAYTDTLRNWTESRHPGYGKRYVNYDEFPYWQRSYYDYWSEPIIEAQSDSLLKEKWNYALKVPEERGTAAYLQKCMREDLDRYFGYDVSLQIREMPCFYIKTQPGFEKKLVPTRTPGLSLDTRKIKFNGEMYNLFSNWDIRDFIKNLHYLYSRNFKGICPFIDKTGITGESDIIVPLKHREVLGNHDWDGYLKILNDLGLYVEKGTKPMKVVVIKDPNSQNDL